MKMNSSVEVTKKRAERKGKQATQDVKPWVRAFARFGYTAKGAIYVLLGALSLMAALGVGGKTTGSKGALETLAKQQYGNILLWLTAIGLIGYIVWRLIQLIKNPENKGIGSRIGYLLSGIMYGALAMKAFSILIGTLQSGGGSSGSSTKQSLTAKVLAQPMGQYVIMGVGGAIILYGLYEMYRGLTEKFKKQFNYSDMTKKEKSAVRKTGKLGLLSRGVVLGLIGYFFIQTAMRAQTSQALGLDAALSKLAEQPYGQWLLGIVSAGLLLFGIFQILKGKNRHLRLS